MCFSGNGFHEDGFKVVKVEFIMKVEI